MHTEAHTHIHTHTHKHTVVHATCAVIAVSCTDSPILVKATCKLFKLLRCSSHGIQVPRPDQRERGRVGAGEGEKERRESTPLKAKQTASRSSTHSWFTPRMSASDSGLQSSGQSCFSLHCLASMCSFSRL